MRIRSFVNGRFVTSGRSSTASSKPFEGKSSPWSWAGPATRRRPPVPSSSGAHRDKVLSHYVLAIDEGATVVTDGGIPRSGDGRDRGFCVQPTILTGLDESARTIREEIFGPVCNHVA